MSKKITKKVPTEEQLTKLVEKFETEMILTPEEREILGIEDDVTTEVNHEEDNDTTDGSVISDDATVSKGHSDPPDWLMHPENIDFPHGYIVSELDVHEISEFIGVMYYYLSEFFQKEYVHRADSPEQEAELNKIVDKMGHDIIGIDAKYNYGRFIGERISFTDITDSLEEIDKQKDKFFEILGMEEDDPDVALLHPDIIGGVIWDDVMPVDKMFNFVMSKRDEVTRLEKAKEEAESSSLEEIEAKLHGFKEIRQKEIDDTVVIGRLLMEAKSRMTIDEFNRWVEDELDMDPDHVDRYIEAGEYGVGFDPITLFFDDDDDDEDEECRHCKCPHRDDCTHCPYHCRDSWCARPHDDDSTGEERCDDCHCQSECDHCPDVEMTDIDDNTVTIHTDPDYIENLVKAIGKEAEAKIDERNAKQNEKEVLDKSKDDIENQKNDIHCNLLQDNVVTTSGLDHFAEMLKEQTKNEISNTVEKDMTKFLLGDDSFEVSAERKEEIRQKVRQLLEIDEDEEDEDEWDDEDEDDDDWDDWDDDDDDVDESSHCFPRHRNFTLDEVGMLESLMRARYLLRFLGPDNISNTYWLIREIMNKEIK